MKDFGLYMTAVAFLGALWIINCLQIDVHQLQCASHIKSYTPLGKEWKCSP